MDIYLNRETIRQIRGSIQDAIDEGDYDTLREDLIEMFSDEQVERLELRVDTGDFYEFISELLDEWSGEEDDELFELLEGKLADADVELRYFRDSVDDEEDEPAEEDDE